MAASNFSKIQKAFTLIELLIVVAIIAILAAIAVPNFLDAQVRSKTARAKADMRSLATAIESYRVDNNIYPFPVSDAVLANPDLVTQTAVASYACGYLNIQKGGFNGSPSSVNTTTYAWGTTLTTPIAYIASLPLDSFTMREAKNYPQGKSGYLFTSIPGAIRCALLWPTPWQYAYSRQKPDSSPAPLIDPWPWAPVQCGVASGIKKGTTYYISWLLCSVGPCGLPLDNVQFFSNTGYFDLASATNEHNFQYYVGDVRWQPPYDPTNGTTSMGKIFRTSAGQY